MGSGLHQALAAALSSERLRSRVIGRSRRGRPVASATVQRPVSIQTSRSRSVRREAGLLAAATGAHIGLRARAARATFVPGTCPVAIARQSPSQQHIEIAGRVELAGQPFSSALIAGRRASATTGLKLVIRLAQAGAARRAPGGSPRRSRLAQPLGVRQDLRAGRPAPRPGRLGRRSGCGAAAGLELSRAERAALRQGVPRSALVLNESVRPPAPASRLARANRPPLRPGLQLQLQLGDGRAPSLAWPRLRRSASFDAAVALRHLDGPAPHLDHVDGAARRLGAQIARAGVAFSGGSARGRIAHLPLAARRARRRRPCLQRLDVAVAVHAHPQRNPRPAAARPWRCRSRSRPAGPWSTAAGPAPAKPRPLAARARAGELQLDLARRVGHPNSAEAPSVRSRLTA